MMVSVTSEVLSLGSQQPSTLNRFLELLFMEIFYRNYGMEIDRSIIPYFGLEQERSRWVDSDGPPRNLNYDMFHFYNRTFTFPY